MKQILLPVLLTALFVPTPANACTRYSRKYNTATTVDFCLWATDGTELKTDAVAADGDVMIMKDEAAEANIAAATEFTDEGQCYSLALTSTETTAARVTVLIVDQGTKAWLDKCLIIETYGHASAQHDVPDANVAKWHGTTIPGVDTAGYPKVTVKDGTGTGEIDTASGVVKANITQIDGTNTASVAELNSCPSSSPGLLTMLQAVYEVTMHQLEATTNTQTLRKYNGTSALCTSTLTDDGSTFTRGRLQ